MIGATTTQHQPIEFSFPFTATVLKRRCSVPVTEMFVGSDHALLVEVPASLACRIHFPAARGHAANVLELMHYDGDVWWPAIVLPAGSDARPGDPSAYLPMLRQDASLLGTLLDRAKTPTLRLEDLLLRKVLKSDRDAMCIRSIKKIERNLAVIDGRVFQRGGEPCYVPRPDGRCGLRIGVAAAGANRDVGHESCLKFAAGDFMSLYIQKMFRKGRMWRAQDRHRAALITDRAAPPFPDIEIVDKTAFNLPAERIRIDALFREALRLMKTERSFHVWLLGQQDVLRPLLLRAQGDVALSRSRLTFLAKVAGQTTGVHDRTRASDDLVEDIRFFEPEKRIRKYPPAPPSLDDEDEAAIASMGEAQ